MSPWTGIRTLKAKSHTATSTYIKFCNSIAQNKHRDPRNPSSLQKFGNYARRNFEKDDNYDIYVASRSKKPLLAHAFAAWKTPLGGLTLQCAQLKSGVKYQLCNNELKRSLRKTRGRALTDAPHSLPSDCPASAVLQTLKPLIGPTNLRHKKESPLFFFPLMKTDNLAVLQQPLWTDG